MAFVSNAARDAGPTIAGFFFQVNVSILRWLDLEPSLRIELECGEDIDTVESDAENGAEKRLLEQLKLRSGRSLTLRSVEALEALANRCVHVQQNPDTSLLFRYLTTAAIGVEINWPGAEPGIATWQAIREGEYGEQHRSEAVERLRSFLAHLPRPARIGESPWELLQAAVADEAAFFRLVMGFEWAVGQPGLDETEAEIRSILLRRGYASDEGQASFLYEHLVTYVFRRLSKRGRAPLTAASLVDACAQRTRSAKDDELIALIRADIAQTNARLDHVESTVAGHSTELTALQQTMQRINQSMGLVAAFSIAAASFSTEVPDSVSPRVSRSRVVNVVREKLDALGAAVLVAEPGSGKTQLVLLIRDQESYPFYWLNIPRDASEAQACILLDAFIRSLSPSLAENSFREVLDAAGATLRNAIVAIEDLPRTVPGGRLATRIGQLYDALSAVGGRLLVSSYYRLTAALEERFGDVHCEVPRFDAEDVMELLLISGAPDALRTEKTAEFLVTVTQGLPVLALGTVRYLAQGDWAFTLTELEPIFRGEVAASSRRDALELLRITVPDPRERELIIRMTLAIGPFSQEDIDRVAKVPHAIPLPGEIVKRATGVWLQQVGADRYLYSPLLGPGLADALDSKTRKGVHFILGTRILARDTITPIDAFAAVNHFLLSSITTYAVLVAINTLTAYIELDGLFTDEFAFSRMWPAPIERSEVDLNLELYLRSVQIVVAAKLGRDIEPQLALFDALLKEAEYNGWGVVIGAGYLAIHLVWNFSASANKYLLYALKAYKTARLPDGSPLPTGDYPMEIMALMSANSCKSDADVDAWLSTIRQFTKTQLGVLASSELAEDNVVLVCDGIWSRELAKPIEDRDWEHVKAKLIEVEETAKGIDFPLLEAAAIRGRIIVIAEFEEHVDVAIELSSTALQAITNDTARFLLFEIMGKQLVIADRDEEGRPFLLEALQCKGFKDALLRRNVLVVLAGLQDETSSPLPTFYTGQAVELARAGTLIPSILVGTLAEHAIAQWRMGERHGSLATLREAVDLVIKIREETTAWKALFYQVFAVLTVYSNVTYDGAPGNGFVEPRQGWFTASHEDRATAFRPEQVAYICIRVAKFAAGIGELEVANEWTWKALSLAEGHAEGWSIVSQFVEYGLPWELFQNRFEGAGKLCVFALLATIVSRASAPAMSLARLRTAIPIVFRLATLVVQGSAPSELETAIAALEEETNTVTEAEGFAASLRRCFLEQMDGQTLTDEAVAAHHAFQYVKSYTLMVGAIVRSPAKESLYLQVRMMETMSGVFSERSQLYGSVIAPFFVEYWKAQAAQVLHPFRTAQAHTLRQLDLSDGTVAGTRRLLSAIRFCMGADLPADAMSRLTTPAPPTTPPSTRCAS
jgi:hypothetical protein